MHAIGECEETGPEVEEVTVDCIMLRKYRNIVIALSCYIGGKLGFAIIGTIANYFPHSYFGLALAYLAMAFNIIAIVAEITIVVHLIVLLFSMLRQRLRK